jgi:Arm DNA-binding domain/Phage integrase, N-terminal SAM-like domain
MPKIRLTDITLKNLKVPDHGTLSYIDTTLPGFAVRVSPSGVKAFTLVYGKERKRANLGRWPIVSIAKARKKAHDLLAERQLGIAHDSPKMTFEEAFTLFLTGYEAKNRAKSVYEMKRLINRHLMPKLKHRNLSSITTDDVASTIERMVSTPAEARALFTAARTLFR